MTFDPNSEFEHAGQVDLPAAIDAWLEAQRRTTSNGAYGFPEKVGKVFRVCFNCDCAKHNANAEPTLGCICGDKCLADRDLDGRCFRITKTNGSVITALEPISEKEFLEELR